MLRARLIRKSMAFLLGPAVIACTAAISGCGDSDGPAEFKPENAPAAKAKDSMDYFRNNMNKKGGAATKK